MRQNLNLDKIRHSLAHLLAAAVLHKFPDTKLGIGPVIENGFYYDFDFVHANNKRMTANDKRITEADLPEIEKEMRRFIAEKLPFSGKKVTASQAKKMFTGQPFKLELIKDFIKEKRQLTAYYTCPHGSSKPHTLNPIPCFVDLCKGGHVKNTSEINPDAFKLTHLAGAYWRGDEKNPQLTRIYAVAFNTKKELDEYLKMQEEAKKRDHKILGPALDLFTFSELVGSGLPLWTPKGTLLRDILDDFVWQLRKVRGYERVDIPHITKKELYERSGHWDKFKDELFKITTRENHLFAMKPMNCPHHIEIFRRRPWSYRELPVRYATTTKVYRDEQSGELAGLSRVRCITQDDAHVFCRMFQAEEEMLKVWDIIKEFYGALGFDLKIRLSLHDPKHREKYLGTPAVWKMAEDKLRTVAKKKKEEFFEAIGEAAFYGPKLDFMAKDSLGRSWQVATIQFDVNMPERFDLNCVSENGKAERVYMVHAAIMGSIERLLSVLIEHFAGAFPLWLAPKQVRILAVSDKFQAYAEKVNKLLQENSIRSEISESNETLGKRIREAEMAKIPYTLVVGEKEETAKSVNVRHYKKGVIGEMELEKLLVNLKSEIETKSIRN